jgi:hypothetical protein
VQVEPEHQLVTPEAEVESRVQRDAVPALHFVVAVVQRVPEQAPPAIVAALFAQKKSHVEYPGHDDTAERQLLVRGAHR